MLIRRAIVKQDIISMLRAHLTILIMGILGPAACPADSSDDPSANNTATTLADGDTEAIRTISALEGRVFADDMFGGTAVVLNEPGRDGEGMKCLKRLRRLSYLHLFGFEGDEKYFVYLEDLKDLRGLILARSSMSNKALRSVGKLRNLEMLCLSDTAVDDNGLVHIKDLAKLRHLELQGTRISDRGLTTIASCSALEKLYIDRTNITDRGMETVGGFIKLETLSLPRGISHIGIGKLTKLEHLKALLAHGLVMNEKCIRESVAIHRKLELLVLGECGIRDSDLKGIHMLKALKTLNISGNHISDQGFAELCGLKNLEVLAVADMKLTDNIFDHLECFPKLRALLAEGTLVSREACLRYCASHKMIRIEVNP
jgi:Leucine-rich repeat (LRR) protein